MNRKNQLNKKEYENIHNWLRRNFGKANRCENSECLGKSTRFEWALREGFGYNKDKEAFSMLCSSCHIKQDYTESRRQKVSIRLLGKKRPMWERIKISAGLKGNHNSSRPIYQFSLAGKFIKEFAHASVAGLNNKVITDCARGRLKTAYGYKWSYFKDKLPEYIRFN